MKNELKNLGLNSYGNNGNYLLITFQKDTNVDLIVKKLRDNKIYVKGPWREPWSKSITISIGPKAYMKKFVDKLSQIMN